MDEPSHHYHKEVFPIKKRIWLGLILGLVLLCLGAASLAETTQVL